MHKDATSAFTYGNGGTTHIRPAPPMRRPQRKLISNNGGIPSDVSTSDIGPATGGPSNAAGGGHGGGYSATGGGGGSISPGPSATPSSAPGGGSAAGVPASSGGGGGNSSLSALAALAPSLGNPGAIAKTAAAAPSVGNNPSGEIARTVSGGSTGRTPTIFAI